MKLSQVNLSAAGEPVGSNPPHCIGGQVSERFTPLLKRYYNSYLKGCLK